MGGGAGGQRRAASDVGGEELACAVDDHGDRCALGPEDGALYARQGPSGDGFAIDTDQEIPFLQDAVDVGRAVWNDIADGRNCIGTACQKADRNTDPCGECAQQSICGSIALTDILPDLDGPPRSSRVIA